MHPVCNTVNKHKYSNEHIICLRKFSWGEKLRASITNGGGFVKCCLLVDVDGCFAHSDVVLIENVRFAQKLLVYQKLRIIKPKYNHILPIKTPFKIHGNKLPDGTMAFIAVSVIR